MVATRSGAGENTSEVLCNICKMAAEADVASCDVCDQVAHVACIIVKNQNTQDWLCSDCNGAVGGKSDAYKDFKTPMQTLIIADQDQLSIDIEKSTGAKKKVLGKEAQRSLNVELMKLEEEEKLKLNFIARKYELMKTYDQASKDQYVGSTYICNSDEQGTMGTGGDADFVVNNSVLADMGNPVRNQTSFHNSALNRVQFNNQCPASFELTQGQLSARQVVPNELPPFNGNAEEWPLFISSFDNSTRLCGFTNDENLLRLQRSLKGKAREYVGSRLLIPALVPEVINTLKMVFGRPEQVLFKLLAKIRATPNVNINRLDSLVTYALEVKSLLAIIEASNLHEHTMNPMLISELVDKLPAQLKLDWGRHKRMVTRADLTVFGDWLYNLAEVASSVSLIPTDAENNDKSKPHRVGFQQETLDDKKGHKSIKCYVCNNDHKIVNCAEFKAMDYDRKWNAIKEKGLCRSCLMKHDAKFCRNRKECGVNGCTIKHNPMLHKDTEMQKPSTTETVGFHAMKTSDVLFKIVPITVYGNEKQLDTYAFLDDGSGPTLIEEQILQDLNIGGRRSDLCLRWTDGTIREEIQSFKTDIKVSALGKTNSLLLKNTRSVKRLDLPKQTMLKAEMFEMYPYMKGLPLPDYIDAVPKIIIGIDNKNASMALKFREGAVNEPTAIKTRLGWTAYGRLPGATDGTSHAMMHLHVCECESRLHRLILESFKLDNDGIVKRRDIVQDDLKILEKNIVKAEDGFVARLLWKDANITLPDNKYMAMKRLECFERKLLKDSDLKNQVIKKIADMQDKNYVRKLNQQELEEHNKRQWYLPIFLAQNPNKPKKIRIVWDAAAKEKGVSLNDCLTTGPDLVPPLLEVLFNFRVGKIGICGDIAEMFHRVGIHPEDQQVQRFMWRDCDNSRPPDIYVLQVMSFGANCSPAIAQYVKNVNAMEFKEEYPRAVESILKYHYVDDMMDSVDTEEECIELVQNVKAIHLRANFTIRNWLTNSAKVSAAISDSDTSKSLCKASNSNELALECEKVLGMWWQTTDDIFTFNLKYTKATQAILLGKTIPTKRQVLKLLMSLFDPLGLVMFFTVNVKILLQDIWRSGIDWDEEISEELVHGWSCWLHHLALVENVKIPRCYFSRSTKDKSTIELHVFVDASDRAYASVAYFRMVSECSIEVSLIGAKSKVAPIRPISIPRMELMAAVMGARYAATIVKAHNIEIASITYWTDSQTVLDWLHLDARRLKQFVALRVAEIQELTNTREWRYISSKENVADLATKWSNPNFDMNSRWFRGPAFLATPCTEWQERTSRNKRSIESEDEKIQSIAMQVNEASEIVDVFRFSKWERLVRCMAYVNKFVRLVKAAADKRRNNEVLEKNTELADHLTAADLEKSYEILHRLAQKNAFFNEIRALSCAPSVALPKSSVLRKLSPFIDKNSIIRMRSRLENSNLISEDMKNPIILHKDHEITRLIVDFYHRKYKHIFHETVINEIFQKYHIPGLRLLFKSIRSKCPACKVRAAKPNPPEMAPLPVERMSPFTRPFSYVGIDFFGPFLTSVGRRHEKRYGMVVTCLTCRAVHLEVAHSLSTSSCIMAIRNFINLRGQPLCIYSDNGTNLRAAEKELKAAYKNIDFNEVEKVFLGPHFKWSFLPPASPHMGGAWERMVRSIKTTLYHIITPDTKLNDEKLLSLFREVEGIINSRPLTYVSLETAEHEALTPNHLILGSSSGHKPVGSFDASDQYFRATWKHVQLLTDKFWKRWLTEVLPDMTKRTKWFDKVKPIENGSIVIIVDPNLPRHQWPKGVIVDIRKAKDGQVRSATVRTATGTYHRPASKIAVLDIANEPSCVPDQREVSHPEDVIPGGGMLATQP